MAGEWHRHNAIVQSVLVGGARGIPPRCRGGLPPRVQAQKTVLAVEVFVAHQFAARIFPLGAKFCHPGVAAVTAHATHTAHAAHAGEGVSSNSGNGIGVRGRI